MRGAEASGIIKARRSSGRSPERTPAPPLRAPPAYPCGPASHTAILQADPGRFCPIGRHQENMPETAERGDTDGKTKDPDL